MKRPRLLLTVGDVAGVGPEVIAGAWPELFRFAEPIVIGDPDWMRRVAQGVRVVPIASPEDAASDPETMPVLPGSSQSLDDVVIGTVNAAAGRAAYDYLCTAIDFCMTGRADGIVTAPLHKEGLRAAGVPHPGHTEILAERTGTRTYAMLLHGSGWGGRTLTVAHVTLHMALRDTFEHIHTPAILDKIRLLHNILPGLIEGTPRIAVAGLNPHASDGGLFGDEEATIIRPAIDQAQAEGIDASGPWPADTLFVRGEQGAFDGVVVMYHDQGHIAMKLHSGWRLVNVTAGLPIVRTSVAHGTAYDIVGQGVADPISMVEAVRVATGLARSSADSGDKVTSAVTR